MVRHAPLAVVVFLHGGVGGLGPVAAGNGHLACSRHAAPPHRDWPGEPAWDHGRWPGWRRDRTGFPTAGNLHGRGRWILRRQRKDRAQPCQNIQRENAQTDQCGVPCPQPPVVERGDHGCGAGIEYRDQRNDGADLFRQCFQSAGSVRLGLLPRVSCIWSSPNCRTANFSAPSVLYVPTASSMSRNGSAIRS